MRRLLIAAVFAAAVARLAAQGFRERVDVQLVRIDLLAADSEGRPVENLGAADLKVTVDGRPVALEGFEPPPPALPDLPRPMPELPPGKKGLPLPLSPEPAAPAPTGPAPAAYSIGILSDETSSEQSNRRAAYGQLFAFLEEPLAPDTLVQLLRFDGKLHAVTPWTADRDLLRKGAALLESRRAASRLGGPGRISNVPEGAPNRPDFDAGEAALHVQSSLTALFDALRQFPERPGRKSLFFITDGAPFLAPPDIVRDVVATSQSDATDGGGADAARRAGMETDRDTSLLVDGLSWDRRKSASLLTDITRLALLRGIEIHPVRSAAHDIGGTVTAEKGMHSRATLGMGRSLDPRSNRSALTVPTTDIAAGQGMEKVAEASGGEAVLSRRFFQDSLRRETEKRPYLLSFRDPYPGDHRFHAVAIAVTRPGLQLRYRRGYRILDAREALVEAAANRMHVPADQNPLSVRLQLDSTRQEDGSVLAEVRLAYPAPPEAGGASAGNGTVQVIAVCGVRDQPLSRPFDLSGPVEPVRFGDAAWLVRSGTIRVRPGAYRWSFAIRDERTGITSYLTFDRALP